MVFVNIRGGVPGTFYPPEPLHALRRRTRGRFSTRAGVYGLGPCGKSLSCNLIA